MQPGHLKRFRVDGLVITRKHLKKIVIQVKEIRMFQIEYKYLIAHIPERDINYNM
jgi:hypothetical protein